MLNRPIAAVLCMVVWSPPVLAGGGPERTRTLTYDATKGEWVELPPPPRGTAQGDLHAIRVRIREGKYRRALWATKKYVKVYGKDDPLYPSAVIARAEALIGRRKYDKAHDVLQSFLDEFGGMGLTSEALRLEFIVAEAYLTGVKRKILGMRLLSGEDVALGILDDISTDYAEYKLAELAIKTKADYLFKKGEHALAELEYARMLKEYPQSRYHQFALRRTADAALASHAGVDYDEAALIEAEERYREYRLRYRRVADREGVGVILAGIHEQRAQKEYATGEYYERTEHLASAVFYYQSVRDRFPDTVAATKAGARLDLLGGLEPVVSTAGPG